MLSGVDICPANGGILRFDDNVGYMWLIQSGSTWFHQNTLSRAIYLIYNKFCHNNIL